MQINIAEYLEHGAARHSRDQTAVIDRDRSFTFAELERHAKRCATLIARRTPALHEPIAVFLPRSAEVVFADLGIVYTGNIYVNLDVHSPAQRIQGILGQTAPVLIISSKALAARLTGLGVLPEQILCIEDIFDEGLTIDDTEIGSRLRRTIDTDPLCIINTSGSTGIPKGVVLNHRSTIDFMDWCFDRLNLTGRERIGSLSPFHFDIYTLELNFCLARGATLVIIPEELAIFPAQIMQFLAEKAISFIFWVPSIMVNISNQGLLERFDLSAIKKVFFAGEVFPMKHLNRWRRALPDAEFVNLYGPIEITVDCTYFVVDREFSDDESLPIGYPCRNTDIIILNENDALCRTGERGELCVRGSSLAMGYWNDPEKTSKAFAQNPLNKRYPELIYRTGDIAYTNERGEIMLVGRRDFQIKHFGYRIELSEIEYQVLRIQGIANACVIYNRERQEITLYYESENPGLTPAAIRTELLEVFPKYMLPTVFHRLEELPRNPNGKIDRNTLSELLLQTV